MAPGWEKGEEEDVLGLSLGRATANRRGYGSDVQHAHNLPV